jgi:hypothetical protein
MCRKMATVVFTIAVGLIGDPNLLPLKGRLAAGSRPVSVDLLPVNFGLTPNARIHLALPKNGIGPEIRPRG